MQLPRLVMALASLSLLHCGGAEEAREEAAGDIAFRMEAEALPGFSKKIGPLPSSGPASVSFDFASTGTITVDASAELAGGALSGKAGKLALDMHLKAVGNLKVDTALKKYDGEIPDLKNLDVPIKSEVAFVPFLLDGEGAQTVADVPETKLPDIPLGSVPGTLQLTIVSGSRVTTKLRGTCLSVAQGQATYTGATTISGTLVLRGTLAIDLPKPLDKAIDLGTFEVAIPESNRTLSGTAAAGAADGERGSCGTAPPALQPPPPEPDAVTPPPPPDAGTPVDAGPVSFTRSCYAQTDGHSTKTTVTFTATPTALSVKKIVIEVFNAKQRNGNDADITYTKGGTSKTFNTTSILTHGEAVSVPLAQPLSIDPVSMKVTTNFDELLLDPSVSCTITF